MVYVDDIFVMQSKEPQAFLVGTRTGHKWCHLWCDAGNEEELHLLAAKVGMKRAWFQDKPGFPHYDLVPKRRELAIKLGAVRTDLREWVLEKRLIRPAHTVLKPAT